ncbi:hypothetical protein RIF29_15728 [Crotalaria pallida]|uniref:Uncharacterized protein n=1 Tax=Crotalaria pallida TaxID=3830 RepID=A0AAN9FDN0_CROPI
MVMERALAMASSSHFLLDSFSGVASRIPHCVVLSFGSGDANCFSRLVLITVGGGREANHVLLHDEGRLHVSDWVHSEGVLLGFDGKLWGV